MPLDELSVIDRFFRPLAGKGAFDLLDDAGRLDVPAASDLVVTADMIAESVHFLPGDPPGTIAQKALRVNLSDLAAKGATPLSYTLSLALTPAVDESWLAAFADGLRDDQEIFGITLLGGDTIVVPDRLCVSVTAFGTAPNGRMVHRTGGKPGDLLFISGTIGRSAVGLALRRGDPGPWDNLAEPERSALIRRYRVPEPRTALAAAVSGFAGAAMDVSDGLVGDCDKLCAASNCSAVIEAEQVPFPQGLAVGENPALVAELMTHGEDFEILAAVDPERADAFSRAAAAAGIPVARIGMLMEGRGPTKVRFQGAPLPLSRRAFVHGRSGKFP